MKYLYNYLFIPLLFSLYPNNRNRAPPDLIIPFSSNALNALFDKDIREIAGEQDFDIRDSAVTTYILVVCWLDGYFTTDFDPNFEVVRAFPAFPGLGQTSVFGVIGGAGVNPNNNVNPAPAQFGIIARAPSNVSANLPALIAPYYVRQQNVPFVANAPVAQYRSLGLDDTGIGGYLVEAFVETATNLRRPYLSRALQKLIELNNLNSFYYPGKRVSYAVQNLIKAIYQDVENLLFYRVGIEQFLFMMSFNPMCASSNRVWDTAARDFDDKVVILPLKNNEALSLLMAVDWRNFVAQQSIVKEVDAGFKAISSTFRVVKNTFAINFADAVCPPFILKGIKRKDRWEALLNDGQCLLSAFKEASIASGQFRAGMGLGATLFDPGRVGDINDCKAYALNILNLFNSIPLNYWGLGTTIALRPNTTDLIQNPIPYLALKNTVRNFTSNRDLLNWLAVYARGNWNDAFTRQQRIDSVYHIIKRVDWESAQKYDAGTTLDKLLKDDILDEVNFKYRYRSNKDDPTPLIYKFNDDIAPTAPDFANFINLQNSFLFLQSEAAFANALFINIANVAAPLLPGDLPQVAHYKVWDVQNYPTITFRE